MKIKKGTIVFLLLLGPLLWAQGKYLSRLASSAAWETMIAMDQADQNRFGLDSFRNAFQRSWVASEDETQVSLSQAMVVQVAHRIGQAFNRPASKVPVLTYQTILGMLLVLGGALLYAAGGNLVMVGFYWWALFALPWNLIPIYPLTEKPLAALLALASFATMALVPIWPKRAWVVALLAAHVTGFYFWSETGSLTLVLGFVSAMTYWWSGSKEGNQAKGIYTLFLGLVCLGFLAVFAKDLGEWMLFQQIGNLPFTVAIGIPGVLALFLGLGWILPGVVVPWKRPELRSSRSWRLFVAGLILVAVVLAGQVAFNHTGEEHGLYSALPLFLVIALVGWGFVFRALGRPAQVGTGVVLLLLAAGMGWVGYQSVLSMQVHRSLGEIRRLAQEGLPTTAEQKPNLVVLPNGAPQYGYQMTPEVWRNLSALGYPPVLGRLVDRPFENQKAFVAALNGLDPQGLWTKKIEVSPRALEIGSRRDFPGGKLQSFELPQGQLEECWSLCLKTEGCLGSTYEFNLGFGRSRCNLKSALPGLTAANGCCISLPVQETQSPLLTLSSLWNQGVLKLKTAGALKGADEKAVAAALEGFPPALVSGLQKRLGSALAPPRLVVVETDPQKGVIRQSVQPLTVETLSPPELLALGREHQPFVLLKSYNHQTFNSPSFRNEEKKVYALEVARYEDEGLSRLKRYSSAKPYGPGAKNQWWVVPLGSIPHGWFVEQRLGYSMPKVALDKFTGDSRFGKTQLLDSEGRPAMPLERLVDRLDSLKGRVFESSSQLMQAAQLKGEGLWFVESQLDFPNQQLSSVEFPPNSENLCRQACDAEQACVAYTYEPKIIETAGVSRCNLKKEAYIAVANRCCTSGQKVQAWVHQTSDLTAQLETLLRRYATEPVRNPQELLSRLEAEWGQPLPESIKERIAKALTPAVFGLTENLNPRQIEKAEVLKGVSLILVEAKEVPGLRKKLKTFDLVLDWRSYATLFRLTYPAYQEFYKNYGRRPGFDFLEIYLPGFRNYQLATAEELKNTLGTTFLGQLSPEEIRFLWEKSAFSFGSADLERNQLPYWPLDYEAALLRLSPEAYGRMKNDPSLGALATDLADLEGKAFERPEALFGALEAKWGEAQALWAYGLLLPYWLEENPQALGKKSSSSLATWFRSYGRVSLLETSTSKGRGEIEVLIYRPQ